MAVTKFYGLYMLNDRVFFLRKSELSGFVKNQEKDQRICRQVRTSRVDGL